MEAQARLPAASLLDAAAKVPAYPCALLSSGPAASSEGHFVVTDGEGNVHDPALPRRLPFAAYAAGPTARAST